MNASCEGDNQTCCALQSCEAPNECIYEKECTQTGGQVVPYVCANPKEVCCDTSG